MTRRRAARIRAARPTDGRRRLESGRQFRNRRLQGEVLDAAPFAQMRLFTTMRRGLEVAS
jgi:hypothetical protein